jgi:hypothetical protein
MRNIAGDDTEHSMERPSGEPFCAVLDRVGAGDFVRIASGSKAWHHKSTRQAEETRIAKDLPLMSCFELPDEHFVYKMLPKYRIMLALYLAYAYLHLGGGCWWPYNIRSSVMLPQKSDLDALPPAFFAATLLKGSDKRTPETVFGRMEKKANSAMPSLVALGRLILELNIGRKVIWDEVDAALAECHGHPFAPEMMQAIEACLKWTKTNSTIREHEETRSNFIKEVIVNLQSVLHYVYHSTVQELFTVSPATRMPEVILPRRVKQSEHLIKAPSAPSSPSRLCLHDGRDYSEKLDDDR